MFTFTQAQVDSLRIIINDALTLYRANRSAEGIFTEAYGAVFDAISQYDAPDTETGQSVQIPADGVPLNVWTWVAGAQDVNLSGSGFPGFIRTYTQVQHELRYGTPTVDTTAYNEIQAASNGVAARFLTELLDRFAVNDYTMLDIHTIGEKDAGAAASEVFEGDYAAWAGTLLFPYLQDSSFFRDLLLTNEPFNLPGEPGYVPETISKFEPGTYDLIASLQTSYIATTQNWLGLLIELDSLKSVEQIQA